MHENRARLAEDAIAREYLRNLIARNFDGSQRACADRLHVSPSLISEFLRGSRSAGREFLRRIAAYTGDTPDAVIGRNGRKTIGAMEGWDDCEHAARLVSQTPEWVWSLVREIRLPDAIARADVRMALNLAELVYDYARPRAASGVRTSASTAEDMRRVARK